LTIEGDVATVCHINVQAHTRNRIFPSERRSWLARRLAAVIVRRVGFLPGIAAVLLSDLRLLWKVTSLFTYLHVRRSSRLSALQREMVATVVNGTVGGAP
jgi:hypothetical protein